MKENRKSEAQQKGKAFDFRNKEIQDEASDLIRSVARRIRETLPDLYWSIRGEEDQKDLGIDMQCELVERFTHETVFIFKLQNKGSERQLEPLKSTANKGLISFQLEVVKAKYYRRQINVALMLMVCDLETQTVYWHPVQLDDAIDNRILAAEAAGKDSIQIYIDPNNKLSPDTAQHFLKDLKESHEEQFLRFGEHLKHPVFIEADDIKIDKSIHLFEQLYQAITQYFDQFSYIPPRELLKLYPFNRGRKGYTRYEGFTMVTDDKEVYSLMASISDPENIDDPNIIRIQDYKQKALTIINQLLHLGIEFVEESTGAQSVQLDRNHWRGQTCHCCRCCYQRGDFSNALKDANQPVLGNDVDAMFKKGYIHYKLGNYITAFEIFEAAAAKAKTKRKWIQYAIAIFNLKNLRVFVEFYAYDHPRHAETLRKIKALNIEKELSKVGYKKYFGGDLVKWLIEQRFYSQYFMNVANTVQEIEKQYHAQLSGGWSTKQTGRKLLSELYQLVSFVNYNFIIFDRYSDFDDLFDFATKGYIASYAMLNTQYSRLEHFNVNVMHQLISYAKTDTIITYYKRFSSRPLQFHPIQIPSLLGTYLRSLLSNYQHRNELQAMLEPGNTDIFRLLGEMLRNAMVLVSLSDLSGSEVDKLVASIIQDDKTHGFMDMESAKYFRYLLSTKGKDITLSTWEQIVEETLGRPLFQDLQLVDVIIDEIREHFPEYTINDELLKEKLLQFEKKDNQRQSPQTEILVCYWFIASSKGKQLITEKITAILKDQFDPSLYYSGAMFKIIDYKNYLKEFIAFARPNENRRSFDEMFSGHTAVFSRPIDMLVNLLFQFDEKLEGSDLRDMKQFSKYYAWLLDLEGFDYAEFDPLWLLNHATSIYMDKFKKIPAIKNAVIAHLKKNPNPHLTQLLLNHFT